MLLQHLLTFCRVVDEGSFTKAADSLNLSQPTVTKQVKNLEEDLGSPLLERDGRHFHLTPGGELVYSYARRILNTVEQCKSALASLDDPGRGDISIGAVLTIVLFTLPKALDKYTHRFPRITMHVRTGGNQDILEQVLRGEIDIGLTTVPINHAEVKTIPLFEDRILLVSSPRQPWGLQSVLTSGELSQAPMICYHRKSQFWAFVAANFESMGVTPHVVMEFDSHEAVKTMVELGMGVAMLPESAVRDDIAAGRLIRVNIQNLPEIGRVTSLLTRRDRTSTPAVLNFIEVMRSLY